MFADRLPNTAANLQWPLAGDWSNSKASKNVFDIGNSLTSHDLSIGINFNISKSRDTVPLSPENFSSLDGERGWEAQQEIGSRKFSTLVLIASNVSHS